MFDVRARLDELRCRPTEWLVARRDRLVAQQRRLRVEELAVTRVLDERGAFGDAVAARDGVSVRAVRETIECARALESLPEVAAVAHAGGLSDAQLQSVTQLADPESDAEWARRAPNVAPADLARLARSQQKPTVEDTRKRREARSLKWWWQPDRGMLAIRGELPDLDGAQFEATMNRMIDRMHPPKGQPWDSRQHRATDALVELSERFADVESPVSRSKPLVMVAVPLHGPAQVAGIPLPDAMVEKLRANAAIEPVLVADGLPVAQGTRSTALPAKITRAVLFRDGHCRWPGCDRRTGLQVHHLRPRSWGGGDEIANLAAVCTGGGSDHHASLVTRGPWVLTGNPNQPDGLRIEPLDQHANRARRSARPPARAGPKVA